MQGRAVWRSGENVEMRASLKWLNPMPRIVNAAGVSPVYLCLCLCKPGLA